MKAIQVDHTGGPEVLQLVEKDLPSVGPQQVLVKVAAAGINFADLMQRSGTYFAPTELPFTPGFEVTGHVESVGSAVTTVREGSRVAALLPVPGGYAEYVVVETSQLIPLPDAVSFAQATALLSQGLTAYFLLDTARVQSSSRVLVHAAAGGVGSLLVQIAKIRGTQVIATASTDKKRQLAQQLGADATVDYTQADWTTDVRRVTHERGVDVIMDSVGGPIGKESLNLLAPRGQWIVYGTLSSEGNALSFEEITQLIFNNQSLHGFSIYGFQDEIPAALSQLFRWVQDQKLRVVVDHQFPLLEAAQAHRAIEARQTTGKVILTA